MSESCTNPYSGGCDESKGGDVDEVVIQFLKELEGPGDAREVLLRYCNAHPSMVGEFRALAGARHVLVMSEPVDDGEAQPDGRLGDFQIGRQIALGGMGAIYEAIQQPFERRVAVKTIRGDRRHLSPGARERFLREQEVLARLHHTHIVPIHAGGQDGDLEYFAMPYIEGAALHHVVRSAWHHGATNPSEETPSLAELALSASGGSSAPDAGGPSGETTPIDTSGNAAPIRNDSKLPLSTKYFRSVAKVMADAGDALHHAHEAGVIHRDVKPSNIMVDRHEHCWVLDFGLAAYQAARNGVAHPAGPEPSVSGATSGIMGTPRYMAPEQFHERADERTDVWGLGVTLYELLTLRPAFDSRAEIESHEPHGPRELIGNLPRDLEAICLKALRKERGDRYATAGEFGDDLRRWLTHEPVRARRTRTLRRVGLWARRNKGWAAAFAAGLAALALTAVGGVLLGKARADYFHGIAAAAVAGEKVQHRESLVQQLMRVQLSLHEESWSDKAWGLVREAAALGFDETLKGPAAATLAGPDARPVKGFREFGGYSVAFDGKGTRLLIASTSPMQPIKANGVRLWDSDSDRVDTLADAGEGPVAFRADGTPLQVAVELRDDSMRTIGLRELVGRRTVTPFAIPGRVEDLDPSQIALTPDARRAAAPILAADGKPALAVWDTATGRLLNQFQGRSSAVGLSPDGTLLARGNEDGQITVWSLTRGEELASLRSGRNTIRALAFSKDRRRTDGPGPIGGGWLLGAGDGGGMLAIWDVAEKVPRAYCQGSPVEVTAIAFSPDGQTVASGGRELRLWDLATGRPLLKLPRATPFTRGMVFSSDGRQLAIACLGGFGPARVDVWAVETNRGVQSFSGLASEVTKFAFSPDGRLIGALASNWQVAVWERKTGTLRHVFDAPKGVTADNAAVVFAPDSRRLAFATSGRAVVWDLDAGRVLISWPLPQGLMDMMAFHPSGRLLLGRMESKDRGTLRPPLVFRVRDLLGPDPINRPLCVVDDIDHGGFGAAVSTDGGFFVVDGVGGPDKGRRLVKVFDPLSGKTLFETTPNFRNLYSCIELDPTGRVLKLIEIEGDAQHFGLLDMPSGRLLRTMELDKPIVIGPGAKVWAALRYAGAGQVTYGYSLHEEGARHLVDLGIDSQTNVCTFDTQGRTFAWGTNDGTVYLADLKEVQRRLAAVGLGW